MPRILDIDKKCPIYWNCDTYGLIIQIPENSITYNRSPIFRFSLKMFMNSANIWKVLGLDTIYWEKPLYSIYTNQLELEYTKIIYLMSFAKNKSYIAQAWAKECLEKTVENVDIKDEVYVDIILFDPQLKEKFIESISLSNARFFEYENVFIVVDN